jgi:hypothetical protein
MALPQLRMLHEVIVLAHPHTLRLIRFLGDARLARDANGGERAIGPVSIGW